MVAWVLWVSYINSELNRNFSKAVSGGYSVGFAFWLTLICNVLVFSAGVIQAWVAEPKHAVKYLYSEYK